MIEKITVLIASVAEREEQLKIVIESIINQIDLIHLVLNWYEEVPNWLKDDPKICVHLNPTNKNAHDAIWNFVPKDGYVLIFDDDLFYPKDYVSKMINAIERHKRRAIITAYGSNIKRPVESYLKSRVTYGFSDFLERDIFVDMIGCGVCAFHASTIQPTLQDFMIPYCRDIYFSLLAAKNKVKVVCLQRPQGWILPLKTSGSSVYETTLKSENLQLVKDRLLKEHLMLYLYPKETLRKRLGADRESIKPKSIKPEPMVIKDGEKLFITDKNKGASKGLVYVAFGKEYDKLAAHTIAYSQQFTDLPICVFTNIDDKYYDRHTKWKDTRNVQFKFIAESQDNNRNIKTSLIKYSPFDLSLFLDCDSVIQKPGIERAFDLIGDNDLLLHKYTRWERGNKVMGIYKNLMLQLKMRLPITVYDSAFLLFRRNERVENFFKLWNTYWDISGRGRDMPALACAANNFDIKIKETTKESDALMSKTYDSKVVVQHEYGNHWNTKFGIPKHKEHKPFDVGNTEHLYFVPFEEKL